MTGDETEWEPSKEIDENELVQLEPRQRSSRNTDKPKPNYNALAYAFSACDPITFKQAITSDYADAWKRAMKVEFDSLNENKTWELVELPKDKSLVKCKWVYKTKMDSEGNVIKRKARLVAKGFTQVEGIDYHDTFSPVVRFTTIRFLMAIAVKFDLNIRQLDVVTAFLHGELDEEIFMTQPEGFNDGTTRCCKLKKSIYGLKQSSRVWNSTLNEALLSFGLKRSLTDQCVYFVVDCQHIFIVAIYVDDLLIFSNNKDMEKKLTAMLFSRFKMKDMDDVSSVLGVRVTRDRLAGTLSLDQTQYIKDILAHFKMSDCNSVSAPMDITQKLSKKMCPKDEAAMDEMRNVPYRQLVGALQFCVQVTRPDICFAVNVLSRYNENPGKAHWSAAKRVLRYLKGTMHKGITYKKASTQIQGYCDSDWASDEDERRSTTGYVFTIQNGAISWCTKRQPTVALSTSEAEFMAMTAAIQEATWLKQLEREILPDSPKAIDLHCDNQGAIKFASNNTYSPRTKHIDVKVKFTHQQVTQKVVRLIYLKTSDMPADVLTKPTSRRKLEAFAKVFGLE